MVLRSLCSGSLTPVDSEDCMGCRDCTPGRFAPSLPHRSVQKGVRAEPREPPVVREQAPAVGSPKVKVQPMGVGHGNG